MSLFLVLIQLLGSVVSWTRTIKILPSQFYNNATDEAFAQICT